MNDRTDNFQYQRLGALFDQAIDLDAAGRAELLQAIEQEDAGLAQALASLLAADARHQARTAEHRERMLQGAMEVITAPDAVVGDRAGPYVLREELGRGGMGVVFRAERADGQVRQEVALKVIKLGMDTRAVIARFEAERQALALMEHPHIARMLDAGATESGRPYFVMELVKGEPIGSYCSKHQLTIVQRLHLFDQVCAAVQHAHTKGIIHRDLKPNNVLVITQDDQPFAKVIDFGIAKATSGRLTDKTLLTEQFLMMGTALYMSPEQAEGSADIDTRTDIYALGVILYELLTDTTPIESDSLRTVAHAEVQRIIREVDPPRPSVRLSQAITARAGAATPGDAAKGGMDPRMLAKTVRGDLDWIAMKAIEKDRARRYETANALALDVRRYLAGEAVLAAPPDARYRMRKFIRRHRTVVTAGSLIAASLLAGIVAFAWQARIAQQRASELEQVARFEGDMLKQVNPTQAGKQLMDDMKAKLAAGLVKADVPESQRPGQLAAFAGLLQYVNATDTARDLIDRTLLKPAVVAIDQQFGNQPVVAATLDQVLVIRYSEMGMEDAALTLQRRTLALRRRVLGETHPDTMQSVEELGTILSAQGKLDEAEKLQRDALAKSRRALGDEHLTTVALNADLGYTLLQEGKPNDAEPYVREALAKRRRLLGKEDVNTLLSLNSLGSVTMDQGKLGEAERYYREAADTSRRVQGEDNAATLLMVSNLGTVLVAEGKMGEAERYVREAVDTSRRVQGEEDPNTLEDTMGLIQLLDAEGKSQEAEPYLRDLLEKVRRVFGEESAPTIMAINVVGLHQKYLGKLAEAEPLLREAWEKSRHAAGEDNSETLIYAFQFAEVLVAREQYAEAEQLLAPKEATTRKVFQGDNSVWTASLLLHLGRSRLGLGKFAAAQADLLEAQALFLKYLGSQNKRTIQCNQALFNLYTAWNAKEPGKGYDANAADWKKKLDATPKASKAAAPTS